MTKSLCIILDPIRFRAKTGQGESLELTAVEYRILSLFLKHKLRPLSKDRILSEIWQGHQVEKKTINVHLTHLRRKLLGIGYKIVHLEKSTFCLKEMSSDLVEDSLPHEITNSDTNALHP